MKTSIEGLQFVKEQEGCVLHPYNDISGHPTIGVGHLIKDGEDFSQGITEEEALDLLAQDISWAEAAVNAYQLELTQGQFDALVDFTFNAGEGALAQLLRHGVDQVPQQLPRWNKSGGQVVRALTRRRALEVEMWGA